MCAYTLDTPYLECRRRTLAVLLSSKLEPLIWCIAQNWAMLPSMGDVAYGKAIALDPRELALLPSKFGPRP